MSVSRTEHAGSLTGTKCSILLAPVTNGAILLNVSWNRPKHPWKENKTSVLCESSGDTCAHVCRGHLRLRGRALACWRLQRADKQVWSVGVYKKRWLVWRLLHAWDTCPSAGQFKRPLYLIIHRNLKYRIHSQGIPSPTSNKEQLVFLRLNKRNNTYWWQKQ